MAQEVDMELVDNTLWHLKQAWYFALTAVNDAVSRHGVSTAQIGVLRQLATEPGLSGAELARRPRRRAADLDRDGRRRAPPNAAP